MKICEPPGASPRLREPDASAFRLILGRLQSAARLTGCAVVAWKLQEKDF